MFDQLKLFFFQEKTPMFATIADTDNGFIICDRNGTQIIDQSYTRRRDAVRGAKRRGLAVA